MIRVFRSKKLAITWFSPRDFDITSAHQIGPWLYDSRHDEETYWWNVLGFQISLSRDRHTEEGYCSCEECLEREDMEAGINGNY